MDKIKSFKNKYYFLSNFYPAAVTYNGIVYNNNEAAFQAQKTMDKNERLLFSNLTPNLAKRKGRHIKLRNDWEFVKFEIMYEICKAKFMQNPELLKLLLDTKDAYLEEGNNWNDKIWGVCNGEGENNLGKILMRIREELIDI